MGRDKGRGKWGGWVGENDIHNEIEKYEKKKEQKLMRGFKRFLKGEE